MSFLNYIPGVAHAKALTHLAFNDKEGYERTMETFHTKTPIVSHLVAGIAKVAGEDELAQKCWDGGNSSLNALPVVGHVKGIGHYVVGDIEGGNKAMVDANSTTSNMADGIPVVGHAKGIVHYVCGDTEGGNKAMKAATRTTAVMGAGAGGFLIGGPVGAVAGGTTAGAEWDLVVAALTDGKEVNGIAKIVDKPKDVEAWFEAGLGVVLDGMAGNCGGKIAKQMGGAVNKIGKHGNENAGAAAAQQLVDELDAGRMPWDEFNQKWNEMKPKGGFNNAPVKDANQAVKGMAKDVGQGVAANSGPSSASGSQQPPQQPTDKKKTDLSEPELRQQLSKILTDIRQRMLQDTGSAWSPADRQFQRESFHEIHTIVLGLLRNGYSASIQPSNQSIPNLVISSPDGSWREEIEYQVADYLDVHDQLIDQQFPLNPQSSCPTVLSATFDESHQLVLSPLMDHEGATNVIYGIRCRICDRRLGPGNINYVGQTTRSVHARVCGEHARSVASTINKGVSEDESRRPMYEHAANHFRSSFRYDLLENTQPRDAFRQVMEVILLPIRSPIRDDNDLLSIGDAGDLRSWESFWQFFLHCRKYFWGWSQR